MKRATWRLQNACALPELPSSFANSLIVTQNPRAHFLASAENISLPANGIQPAMTKLLRAGITLWLASRICFALASAQMADPALNDGLKLLEEARTTLEDVALTNAQTYFAKLTQSF